jgi:transcriptional regulator with XRE-family HTH domain
MAKDGETQPEEPVESSDSDGSEDAAGGDSDRSSPSFTQRLMEIAESVTGDVSDRLRRLALDATGLSLGVGQALFMPPQNAQLAQLAGSYLRELRELAGLTREELAEAIRLEDRTLLQAVEEGTAILSFELILRLAAILARHDPVPFLIRFTRTYNPEVWSVLENFGVGRLPLHFEREREFINIYRGEGRARQLSDEGFARVLELTQSAFQLGLHFALEDEARDRPQESSSTGNPDEASRRNKG